MDTKDILNLQEAYLGIYDEGYKDLGDKARNRGDQLLKRSKLTATGGNMITGKEPSNTPEGKKSADRARRQYGVSAFHDPEASQAKASANRERGQIRRRAFGNRLRRADGQGIRDSYDYYDIIFSHLLDEGYAETPEAAEAIMVNMSDEWKNSILG